MAKPLSQGQLQFLRHVRDGSRSEGTSRGLIARNLLRYKWGNDPSYGYVITAAGKAALAEAGM